MRATERLSRFRKGFREFWEAMFALWSDEPLFTIILLAIAIAVIAVIPLMLMDAYRLLKLKYF